MSFCYADPYFVEEEAGQKAAEEFTLDQWSVVTRVSGAARKGARAGSPGNSWHESTRAPFQGKKDR